MARIGTMITANHEVMAVLISHRVRQNGFTVGVYQLFNLTNKAATRNMARASMFFNQRKL